MEPDSNLLINICCVVRDSDKDLVSRDRLEELEKYPQAFGHPDDFAVIDGCSWDVLNFHVDCAETKGYLEVKRQGGFGIRALLTHRGHSFLDSSFRQGR